MSFLTPLFLLGGLALAAPILFHLIRRTTREKEAFSSLMFLKSTPPRVTRRSRLENILLLVLRCLILALLALAFARPFFSRPVDADSTNPELRKTVVLLDLSASMRREDAWKQALGRAEKILREAGPGERIAVLGFDREVRRVVSFEQWSEFPLEERAAVAVEQLKALEPGWQKTDLGRALVNAVEMLEETDVRDSDEQWSGTRRVVLIADLQQGSDLTAMQAYEWPKGVELELEPIEIDKLTNAGIQVVHSSADEALEGATDKLRVRVSNTSDAKREQFRIGWAEGAGGGLLGKAAEVYVPPGQSRVYTVPPAPSGKSNLSLVLEGDDVDFDNRAWNVPPVVRELKVIYLGGGEDPSDIDQPLFYLNRAFQKSALEKVSVETPAGDEQTRRRQLFDAALSVVTQLKDPASASVLREVVETGRTALVVLMPGSAKETVSLLFGEDSGQQVREGEVGNYALLGRIDFTHPLFAPFADPRFSDFTKIQFWKYRVLAVEKLPGAAPVAVFDNGDPAVVEVPMGRGRVVLLASGWHPADSNLALSSKFVPLLYSLLEMGGGGPGARTHHQVGDVVALAAGNGNAEWTVMRPDGKEFPAKEGIFRATDLPGIYEARAGTNLLRFAINLAPSESRTEAVSAEELGLPVMVTEPDRAGKEAEAANQRRLLKSQLENRQKVWWWLIVAALVVVIGETWVAGRLTRPA